ncbi:hypothetical protein HR086_15825 [Myxococcus sp. CA039A]|nr:hypothetical protein [Myxococcus sp. CA039A]
MTTVREWRGDQVLPEDLESALAHWSSLWLGRITDTSRDYRVGANLQCSFCEKYQYEVRHLIAGPNVFICDECVGLCNDVIQEEKKRASK